MADEILVFVTCPTQSAKEIGRALVIEGLAACVNIVPAITSIFKWEGKLSEEQESLLVIKTNKQLWTKLEKRVLELHSYDVPEIICVPIELGHKPYLDWLNKSVSQDVLDQ